MKGAPVRSQFAEDADYRELLEWFVTSVPVLCDTLREQHRRGDYDGLRVQAHQVKGAGGGYGFPELTAIAGDLESACRTPDPDRIIQDLDRLLSYFERIVL